MNVSRENMCCPIFLLTALCEKCISHIFCKEESTMEKLTAPRMTKFERAQLIGMRTEQIARGAPPNVEVLPGSSVRDIAVAELVQKKIPLKIQRQLPNGLFETWGVDEMDLDEI